MRRGRRVGAGLEFADHRDYVPGDDLRYLDWNLYGRLERRALRLFEEDEDLPIDVLVDASRSMAMGAPPKLELALQVGAALAYVALANLDRVAVTVLGRPSRPACHRARQGPHPAVLRLLRAGGRRRAASRCSAALRAFLLRRTGAPPGRGHPDLRLLRPGRGAGRAGPAALPPAGNRSRSS